jgi:hypothetical protein
MAVPSYTTDLTTYNDCSDPTGWDELTGMASSAPPDIDTDLAIHGGTCISSDRADTGLSSNAFVGAGFTLAAGECVFIWHKFFAPNSLATLALGGIRVMIGDSASVWDGYYVDGSDTYAYGGWRNYAVDPTITPDSSAGTTTGTYAMVGNGWNLPTQAPFKGNPFGTDIIRYGRGESIFTGGQAADYATFAGYALVNDNPTTGRFGLIQAQGTGFLYKGLISLGTTATAVDMRDSNVSVTIDNTLKVLSSFNKIEVVNAASNIEWTSVSFASLSSVSRGQFEMIDNATLTDVGGTFTDMDTFIYQSNSTITGRTYRRCNQVTQGGSTITDCVFDSPNGTVGLLVDTLGLITGTSFSSAGTGHGVNLGTISSTQSLTWDNTDTGYTASSSGNETILVSVDTGITLTINVSATASTPSVYNTGLGTVNVVAGLKTFSFTLNPSITGYEWRIYAVSATGSLVGAVELAGEEVATADNQAYSYSYSVDDAIAVQILSGPYEEYVSYYTLGNSDQEVTINLRTDDND